MDVLTRPVRCAGALALVAATSACATLVPPISYSSTASPEDPEADSPPLELRPVEGRPSGPVLEFRARFSAESRSTLRLLRGADTDQSRTLLTLELGPEKLRRLTSGGLRFVDRDVIPGERYRYRLVYFQPERGDRRRRPRHSSEVVELHWHEPPDRPASVEARATTPHTVEVHWQPEGAAALVFRRDVLADGAASERFAARGADTGGVVLDRSVSPGGVYAYRVALAAQRENYIQYGQASEPLYVSVPER